MEGYQKHRLTCEATVREGFVLEGLKLLQREVISYIEALEAFEKPSVKRKKKDIAARKNRSKRGFSSRPKRKEY